MTEFLTAIAASALNALIGAWFVMLLLGAAHSGDARIPALSYGVTLALTVAAGIATTKSGAE